MIRERLSRIRTPQNDEKKPHPCEDSHGGATIAGNDRCPSRAIVHPGYSTPVLVIVKTEILDFSEILVVQDNSRLSETGSGTVRWFSWHCQLLATALSPTSVSPRLCPPTDPPFLMGGSQRDKPFRVDPNRQDKWDPWAPSPPGSQLTLRATPQTARSGTLRASGRRGRCHRSIRDLDGWCRSKVLDDPGAGGERAPGRSGRRAWSGGGGRGSRRCPSRSGTGSGGRSLVSV